MISETQHVGLNAFHLSRIHASAEFDGYRLCADRAQPSGSGVRLRAYYNGEVVQFWTTEAEWCEWLLPQLPAPNLSSIDDELLPLLASWTLAPLDGWLQESGVAPLHAFSVEASAAPALCWRFILRDDTRALSIYLESAPSTWLMSVLEALHPSQEQEHTLTLGLGWCMVRADDWRQLNVGDAIPIMGMAEELDTFWLQPDADLGRIQLQSTSQAIVKHSSTPALDPLPGTLQLTVEAGCIYVPTTALADWRPDTSLIIRSCAYPTLRLSVQGQLVAQGQLINMSGDWAVRTLDKR